MYKIARHLDFLAAYPSLERNRFSNWFNLSSSLSFVRTSILDITSLISSVIRLTMYKITRLLDFLAAYPSLERNRFSNWFNLSSSLSFVRTSILDIASLSSSLIRCSSLF